MSDLQILQPQWLLLLLPLWLLLAFCARKLQQKSIWQRLCDPHLLAQMTTGQGSRVRHSPVLWLIGSLLSLGIVIAAAPSWSRATQPILEASTARVIVLDLSRAMRVQDLKPDRYQHAVAAASELLGKEYDGETGLVVFSAAAFVVAPLSRDADTLLAFVEAMHPETMPVDGYNLAQAIRSAQALLAASFGGHGDILVLSAGDSHDESAITAARDAALQGHRVFILAIGSKAGGPVVDANGGLLRDPNGSVQISKTNFALLQRIADVGNGDLAVAVADLANDSLLMSRLGAGDLVEAARTRADGDAAAADDGVWLVWLMLPLTLLLFRRNVLSMLLLLILLPAEQEAFAVESPSFWKHAETIAFDAYQRQDFATAATLSADPLLRGASLYRNGEYQLALQQFDDESSASAMYNRGNTLVQLQRYTEAIRAYQQALVLEPEFDSASHNMRLLELYLQQAEAVGGMQSDETTDADSTDRDSDAFETQNGVANDVNPNPADQQDPGAGFGAAQQSGQVDPQERFLGEEDAQQRFELRAGTAQRDPEVELIDRWISSLPETSSELYRRKFLRDYRRQQGRQQ